LQGLIVGEYLNRVLSTSELWALLFEGLDNGYKLLIVDRVVQLGSLYLYGEIGNGAE
jgi:hypothetical protein